MREKKNNGKGSDPAPVFRVGSGFGSVFSRRSDPDPGHLYPDPQPLNLRDLYIHIWVLISDSCHLSLR